MSDTHTGGAKKRFPKSGGLTFIELMIALFILSMVFLFCLPFFITAKYSTTKEGMVIQATETSQGIIDRLKRGAHAFDSTTNDWVFSQLETVYDVSKVSTVNPVFLNNTPFKQDTSYIVVEKIDTTKPPPDNMAKKVTVHLEWIESHGGQPQLKEFTNVSYIAQPAVTFAFDPNVGEPPGKSSSILSTISRTISVSISQTISLSTSQIPTTSQSISQSVSVSVSRIPTTSNSRSRTISVSVSQIPTTSTSVSRIPTTSTSVSRTVSVSVSQIPTTSTSVSRTVSVSTSVSQIPTTSIRPSTVSTSTSGGGDL